MPDTIILAAEPESPGFHPQGKITEVPKTNWGIGGKTAKSIGR